jgi:hypothetical protein
MQFSFGLRAAEKMLPGRSSLFINAETEINPRFPLPREEALAYAIGLLRIVCCSCDVTGGTVVCSTTNVPASALDIVVTGMKGRWRCSLGAREVG